MNRIETVFNRLRREGRKGLVGYLTAGDPDAETSERDIRAAIAHGVDIVELGVPFSDPTADGPIIQEAARRALAAGMSVAGALDLVRALRKDLDTPIVLFGYANPFFRYGYERLARDAAEAGADAFLVVDLPMEMAGEFGARLAEQGLFLIPLIAPTTGPERAAAILRAARGFVYYVMVRGVTGARATVAGDAPERLAALRRVTRLPIAAGFGVSSGAQAGAVAGLSDAVVVGSALVRAARENRIPAFVGELRAALDAARDVPPVAV